MSGSHVLIVGGSRKERRAAAEAQPGELGAAAVVNISGRLMPFLRISGADLPSARPRVILIDEVDCAFPDSQTEGMRLVVTQAGYMLQKWIDVLDPGDSIIATAELLALSKGAPEARQGRGPWRQFRVLDLGVSVSGSGRAGSKGNDEALRLTNDEALQLPPEEQLARAYRSPSSDDRLQLCRMAAASAPRSAVALLALASAYREVGNMEGARGALDEAAKLAPDWEAVHYENGKFWLAADAMDQAREAFQRASELMPTFSAAQSNLGATLGELGRSEEAAAAFERALISDPDSFTILNNLGVLTRELGRFRESEEALRRVISLNPDFVFGYYNLGHTLFLDRQFPAALEAYEEGHRRDPQKNRRQGCRLAVMRFANGDVEGAERDLWRFADQAPPEEREDLLLEAYEIAHALVVGHPQLTAQQAFLERIAAEVMK